MEVECDTSQNFEAEAANHYQGALVRDNLKMQCITGICQHKTTIMVLCLCSFTVWVAFIGLLTGLIWYLSKNGGPPVRFAGVYIQPGTFYYVKVVAFYLLMKIRKWKDARDQSNEKDHTKLENYKAGYGVSSKNSPAAMDKLQPLSEHFQAIDAIYFNGANKDGFYIVTATARRPHGAINGFLIITVPEVGTLVTPRFPDTLLFGGTEEYYGAEGFRFEPVTPMKHWKLAYNGQLKLFSDPDKKFDVKFEADWKSNLPYFDYDNMIPPWTMARAIAKETWSREYFQQLKEAHQTHYEQHGELTGKIVIGGKTYNFSTPSMRDHSYGVKRDWKLLHRYIFHMFHISDGRRFNIGNVCQPSTSSHLELGYMYEADGTMKAVEWLDLPLWNIGENGVPATDYGFSFKAAGGKVYYVQVQVLDTQVFHIGWEWEAKIVERRCRYFVDGVEGYGISEWQYRHTAGRPETYSSNDPEWVKTVKTV